MAIKIGIFNALASNNLMKLDTWRAVDSPIIPAPTIPTCIFLPFIPV